MNAITQRKRCRHCERETEKLTAKGFCSQACANLETWEELNPPPSPEEIAKRAAAIRATWSEAERLERLGMKALRRIKRRQSHAVASGCR
jgi:hypothetical protein